MRGRSELVFFCSMWSQVLVIAKAWRWHTCRTVSCLTVLAVHVGFGILYAAVNAVLPAEQFF
jgi:hypothetical protein